MKFNFSIDDQKTLDTIERLRGKKSAVEFLAMCLRGGIFAVEAESKRKQNAVKFAMAKPEFRGFDIASLTEALKSETHPATGEINRLVKIYTAQFMEYSRQNGGKFPAMRVQGTAPIEKIALQKTAELVKKSFEQQAVGQQAS